MDKIKATRAKYIKLGAGGAYEKASFDEGKLCLSYGNIDHAIGKDFEKIKSHFLLNGVDSGAATRHAQQVFDFYTEPKDTLWITFSKGLMYWCQAEEEVLGFDPSEPDGRGTRYRKVIDKWHSTDIKDNPLKMNELSGNLTKTAGFRGTICNFAEDFNYILDKINAETIQEVITAEKAETDMLDSICLLMNKLCFEDFELLVDLVFARSQWRRINKIGGAQKFFDIQMESLIIGETAGVQVKSATDKNDINKHIDTFNKDYNSHIDKFFFVYHTPEWVQVDDVPENIYLINAKKLSKMVLDAGLFNWLLNKISYSQKTS